MASLSPCIEHQERVVLLKGNTPREKGHKYTHLNKLFRVVFLAQ